MAREIWKTVKFEGSDVEYSIQKFDAMTGMCIARLLLAKAAPIIPVIMEASDEASEDDVFAMVGKMADTITDAELKNIIRECLKRCYVMYPAGKTAIIDADGHYGVEDIEYDMGLTMRLCFEAIKWGASDFFGGKGLDLKAKASSIFAQQNQ